MRSKYVIGRGRELQRALAAWRELAPETELRPVDMAAEGAQAALDAIDPLEATAFVAADAYFLNFHRLELMSAVRGRGIAMPPLIERGAIVGADVKIPDNCWIGAGAVIQPGCRIGFNVVIGPGAIVGGGAEIGQSAFIDAGVTVGHGARIGTKATLGLGVAIGHGVEIGTLCVIDKPGRYEANIAAKTFIQPSHAHPVVIFGE
ncbi:UDP-3-O-(3-hydroxymyristoyl)glucosamine N-acyltransferase [Massilia sp. Bi118]|uniref:hypothetical protein n=1 Tax=Massilia sp. Bi118 TaxID=2822346 RepID=UPI001D9294A2|nr:hypothetical protein [Massilia sp. Bi118]CAH0136577.1 UDP-3-O-(3-hydroxymyristoyl)glucosamine N-acyltransferase [Massilia sp. Bi118]